MPTDRDDETVQTQAPPSSQPNAPRARDSRSSLPAMLGRYRVIKLLGRGGVGAVYEAEDPEVGRRVAIKVLRDDKEGDTEALRGEAQALGRLVHPNVVTIYDVGVAGGDVFLVMQLVDGEPLDRWLASRAVSPREILAMFRQAGLGLAAAHAAGLVHCDFKPGNILVDRHGIVRVSDFGLARATRAHAAHDAIASASMISVSGTPAYMAPEQFDGVATAATDQFSYCVALWEVLAGERPFEDSSIHATDIHAARGPVRELPPTARIPTHLVPVLERGLSPVPADRYPSMDALLAALAAPAPRRKVVVAGAVAGSLLVVGIVAFAWTRARSPAAAPVGWSAADVAHQRVLTTAGCDDSPVIDGSTVVFGRTIRDDVDLYAVPLAGGTERRLTEAATWEWRPNVGRRAGEVTYLVHNGRTSEGATVAYLDLASGATSTAAAVYAWDALVAGGVIAYSPDEPAGIRQIVERRDLPLLEPPEGVGYVLLAAAPTGDRIATTRSSAGGGPVQACTVELATRAITCSPTRSSAGRPAFGADGRALYFSAEDGLRRRDLVTGDEAVFLPGVWSDGGLAVAPDGSALVYSLCRGNYSIVDVTTTPAKVWIEGPDASEIAVSAAGPIAWVRDIKGIQILEARTAEGRELQLTDVTFGSVSSPVFSPDGRQILFGGSGQNPGLHTLRMSNPGAPHRLTDDPRDAGPTWTPAGVIGFTRAVGATSHAFVIGRDGLVRQLSKSTRWVYGNRGEELLVDTGEADVDSLRWIDIATGAERPGPVRPEGLVKVAAVSPDGNWLGLLIGFNGQDVWRVRVDPPGPPEHVFSFGPGMTGSSITITNDGHALVTQAVWAGGLLAIPARPGMRF